MTTAHEIRELIAQTTTGTHRRHVPREVREQIRRSSTVDAGPHCLGGRELEIDSRGGQPELCIGHDHQGIGARLDLAGHRVQIEAAGLHSRGPRDISRSRSCDGQE